MAYEAVRFADGFVNPCIQSSVPLYGSNTRQSQTLTSGFHVVVAPPVSFLRFGAKSWLVIYDLRDTIFVHGRDTTRDARDVAQWTAEDFILGGSVTANNDLLLLSIR